MKATNETSPMPTTKDLYEMFKDLNESGNFPVPFTNTGFYADQLQDFFEANEQPISYDKAKRIARSLRNLALKEHPLYNQEIKIVRNLAIKLRAMGPLGEYRTFSEPRVKGRRLKFWGVKDRAYSSADHIQVALFTERLHRLQFEAEPGLQVAGWQLSTRLFRTANYNTLNVALTITRIGS